MKVSLVDLKKAKAKKRTANEGRASKPKKVVSKRSRVPLEGPSTLIRAPATYAPSAPIVEEDDEKVEVISAPIPAKPIFSSMPAPMVAVPRQLSTLVPVEAEKKGKAPVTSKEPKETP